MIQRIQNLWLAGIFLITLALLFGDMGIAFLGSSDMLVGSTISIQKTCSIAPGQPLHISTNYLLISSLLICGLIAIVSISLFRNLSLQQRLINLNYIFILALLFCIYYTLNDAVRGFDTGNKSFFSPSLILPFLMLLFNYLAHRGNKKDRELLASVDRLR